MGISVFHFPLSECITTRITYNKGLNLSRVSILAAISLSKVLFTQKFLRAKTVFHAKVSLRETLA